MNNLSRDANEARKRGISYGRYMATEKLKSPECRQNESHKKQKRKKKYNDLTAFLLWQEGKTDAEIASVFGVSRTIIQRWRDTMELPSTSTRTIDTAKYRIEETDGTYHVFKE